MKMTEEKRAQLRSEMLAEMKKRIVVRPVWFRKETKSLPVKAERDDGVIAVHEGREEFFLWSQVDGWKIWHEATKSFMFVPR